MVQSCFKGFLLLPIAILLPPLAILIDKGCGTHFIANCFLTFLLFVPGIVNALLVIYYFEDPVDNKSIKSIRTNETNEDIHAYFRKYNGTGKKTTF
uniref:G_PROTEIN_RECEP_F1_2 domain-containing protein n=1 Tax=Parastrongyloides trichosuri TaxID=131310 RepID=A0A0N4ZRS8_PARTI